MRRTGRVDHSGGGQRCDGANEGADVPSAAMSEDDRRTGPCPGAPVLSPGSSIGRALAAIARACGRRPLLTVVVSVALGAAAVLYTLHALTFVTSNLRLLPQHERYVVLLKEYQRDFGELNDIVVVVESPTPDLSKAYAARLIQDLERRGLAPSRITYRVDPAYFDGRGLLYLSVDELIKLRDRLFDYQEFIEAYAAHPTLPRLLEGLNQQIANAMALGFFDLGLGGSGSTDLRFLEAVIDQISARLDGKTTYTSPWNTAFSVGRLDDPDAAYYFSSDRRWLFLFVQQRREDGTFADSRGTIEAIRGTIAGLRRDFPDVQAGRDRRSRHLQRRDGHRLRRQQGGHVPGLRAHARAAGRRLPARRQAALHAGDARREPGLVARDHHARRRPPQHLLGDVHLHRGRHRHRLRDLLPLPVPGGAVAPAVAGRRARPNGRAGGAGHPAQRLRGDGRVLRADAHRLSGHPGVRLRGGRRRPDGVPVHGHPLPGPPRAGGSRPDSVVDGRGGDGGSGEVAGAHHPASQDDPGGGIDPDRCLPSGAPSTSTSTTTCSSFRPRAWSPCSGKSGSSPRPDGRASPRSPPPRAWTSSGGSGMPSPPCRRYPRSRAS